MRKLTFFLAIVILLWVLVAFSIIISNGIMILLLCIASFILLQISFDSYKERNVINYLLSSILIFELSAMVFYWYMGKSKVENNRQGYYILGRYKSKNYSTSHTKGGHYYYVYTYSFNEKIDSAYIEVSKEVFNSVVDTMDRVIMRGTHSFYKMNLSAYDIEKYSYPVKFACNAEEELGNDSYEYAIYEPMRAYDNFGLNIVYKSHKTDAKYIYFYDILKNEQKIEDNTIRDTFLVYSNINPKYFDGWHICSEKITTPENIAKIDSAGYGYLFRGKIYSAAETEKYWNIIEQYKLRTLTSKP